MKNFNLISASVFVFSTFIISILAFTVLDDPPEYIILTLEDCPSLETWESKEAIDFIISSDIEGDDLIQMIDEQPCEGLNFLFQENYSSPAQEAIDTDNSFSNSFDQDAYERWSHDYRMYWEELEQDEGQLQEGFEIAKSFFDYKLYEESESSEEEFEGEESESELPAPIEKSERLLPSPISTKARPANDVPSYRISKEGEVEYIPKEINPSPPPPPAPRNPNRSISDIFTHYYNYPKNMYWPPQYMQTTEVMQGSVQPVVFFVDREGGGKWPEDQKTRFRKIFKDGTQHWLKAAKKRNFLLHFNTLKEHKIDMTAFGFDQEKWTQQELTYTCLVQSGLWKKYFKTVPKMSDLFKRDSRQIELDIQNFADETRIEFKTDWAFFIFAVYTGDGLAPKLTSAKGFKAGAYVSTINNSAIYMNFTWHGYGVNEYVIPHEIGHVFGAIDHYREDMPCEASFGYFNIPTHIQYQKPPHLKTPACKPYQTDIMDGWYRNRFAITEQTLDQVGMKTLDKDPPKMEMVVAKAFEVKGNRTLYLYEVAYQIEIGTPLPNNNLTQFTDTKADPFSKNHLETFHYQNAKGNYQNVPISNFTYHNNRKMKSQRQFGVLILGQWDKPIVFRNFKVKDAHGKISNVELRGTYTGNQGTANEWQPSDRVLK